MGEPENDHQLDREAALALLAEGLDVPPEVRGMTGDGWHWSDVQREYTEQTQRILAAALAATAGPDLHPPDDISRGA